MKVNKLIASAIISGLLAMQTWTLKTVVDLKVQVAELKIQVTALNANNNKTIVRIP